MTERYLPTQAQVDELRRVFGPKKLEVFLTHAHRRGKYGTEKALLMSCEGHVKTFRELADYLTEHPPNV
jgi:hypothetical protein